MAVLVKDCEGHAKLWGLAEFRVSYALHLHLAICPNNMVTYLHKRKHPLKTGKRVTWK